MEHGFGLLIAALSGFAGVLGGSFWFHKWVKETDDAIMDLSKKVGKLIMKVEIANGSTNKTEGSLSQIQKAINDTIGELAKTSAKIDALWRLIDSQFSDLTQTRVSDKTKIGGTNG